MRKTQSVHVRPARSRTELPSREILHAHYRKTVLTNGIRVVTEHVPHVRSLAIGIWLNVGSRHEDARTNGISHFVEHMVFKGTKRYTTSQIAHSLESVGGFLNAFTTKEHTCFYARVLDRHLERAIDVLSDLVLHPRFDAGDLEKEKQVVLDELRSLEDDPDDLIHDYFDRMTFGSHPLGFPVIGRADTISTFNRELLFDHLRRHYQPHRMVVAAAGNIRHSELVDIVEKYFSASHGRNNRAASSRVNPPHVRKSGKVVEYDKPISQAHVCTGTLGFSARSRHRYALLVVNTLLGDGMSSRLFQNIREKYGFAYNIYSFANMLSDTGTFGVYIGTDEKNIENSLELIYKELNKMRVNTISNAELQRTKEQLKGSTVLSLESMSGRMMRLGSGELLFGEYFPVDSILRQIDEVTHSDIHEVTDRLFDPSRFSTVIFRPAQSQRSAESSSAKRPAQNTYANHHTR